MKLLMFSDPHCTRSSEFSRPTEDGYNEYLQSCLASFKFVGNLVHDLKPDILAFGGDFWDARDYVDTISLNVGFKIWQDLSVLPVDYKIAILGNHDYFSIEHNIHTLEILKGLDWFVFERPELIRCGVRVLGVPYRDQYDLEELKVLNNTEPDIVIAHCDVIGGKRRNPRNSKDTKAYSDSGLPASTFNLAGTVLNGHYHHPAKVSDNWYNIGSLTSRTFHDKGSEPRGAVFYDTETREVTRCPNPYAKDFIDVLIENEADLVDILEEDYSNSYARIYYDLKMEDEAQTIREMFAGARLLPIAKKKAQIDATTVDLRFSLEENLQRFVDERYDDQRLTRMALEILESAGQEPGADSGREPLEFGKLELRHFQSIGHLELDLRNRGLIFVRGVNNDDPGQDVNGSGKSSFVEGVYWCLTGKSLRGYKGNEVIHWDEDYTRVKLEIFVGDQSYTVIRSRRDPVYGTGLKLYIGDVSAGARLTTDTNTKLEELIGRSEDSLRHVCFMTSGLANRFSKLTYPQRARLLEDIIDSRPYLLCKKISDERLRVTRLRLSRIQGSLDTLTESKKATEDRIEELNRDLVEFDEMYFNQKVNAEVREKTLVHHIKEQQQQEREAEEDLLKIAEEVVSLRGKQDILASEILAKYDTIAGLRAEATVVDADIKRLGLIKNQELCPTCEQPVNQSLVARDLMTKHVAADVLNSSIQELELDHDRLNGRRRKIDAALSARADVCQRLRNIALRARAATDELNAEKEAVLEELRDIETSREKFNSQLVEREKELSRLQPQLLELMDEEEKVEADEKAYEILSKEVFDEKGVRNSILSQVAIPYLNSRIPAYSQYLWGGRTIELMGSRDLKGGKTKNDIDISLGSHLSYKGASSGEKRRIDLIIQLALNDLAAATGRSRVGMLMIDEAFDTLDESGIYAAREALREKTAGTIFMISHRKYAAAICPRQISFIKEKRYTRLLDDHTKRVES